jgi:hypothetical protein
MVSLSLQPSQSLVNFREALVHHFEAFVELFSHLPHFDLHLPDLDYDHVREVLFHLLNVHVDDLQGIIYLFLHFSSGNIVHNLKFEFK